MDNNRLKNEFLVKEVEILIEKALEEYKDDPETLLILAKIADKYLYKFVGRYLKLFKNAKR